uniref:U3 small nucleolar RNA-associated protein 11 n=1 Tax=Albugo laibachii Nc14 TaxID=890382 RepID=F0WZN2_9STRA|nr:U3 small nucleolar RNAassociated protein putative [Albugo laibachii Nc14]|eukprot:CCA26957.1 U3 small nucleolar RNAassociated protein putative [Albugo laibachii Nc14]
MSSLRNVVKRREHKERGQLHERKRLGLLEKHKDYVLRARDYHNKQKRLRSMQLKAAFRNPDEFYFKMHSSRTEEGVHVSTNNHADQLSAEALQILKTQDLAYLQMKRSVDLSKAEKLRKGLHFVGAPAMNQHTIYVDTDDQVQNFNVASHFETPPELATRSFNRIRNQTLAETKFSSHEHDRVAVETGKVYRELCSRLDRANKLGHLTAKLDLERKIQAKGKKKKVVAIGEQGNSLPVYRWKKERQK